MPIYDTDMSREQMEKAAWTHVCSICHARLVVCWGGAFGYNGWVLRCSRDARHNGIERPAPAPLMPGTATPTTMRKEDFEALEKQVGTETATALRPYQTATLTQRKAKEIVATLWPGAPEVEKLKAAMICAQYGLNPLMKHLFIIPYQKRDKSGRVTGTTYEVVLGIKATRLIAGRQRRYGYLDGTPRAATEAEIKAQFGPEAERIMADFYVGITKVRDADGFEATGFGLWPKADTVKGREKGNTPQNMANIRSERQALDRLLPGAMPADTGVTDEQYTDYEVTEPSDGAQPEPDASEANTVAAAWEQLATASPSLHIDLPWVRQCLKALGRTEAQLSDWVSSKFHTAQCNTLEETLEQLDALQQSEVERVLRDALVKAGKEVPAPSATRPA